jgi:hypothetical protein
MDANRFAWPVLLAFLLAQGGLLVHSAELPDDCVSCEQGVQLHCAQEDCHDQEHHHHASHHHPSACRICGTALALSVEAAGGVQDLAFQAASQPVVETVRDVALLLDGAARAPPATLS